MHSYKTFWKKCSSIISLLPRHQPQQRNSYQMLSLLLLWLFKFLLLFLFFLADGWRKRTVVSLRINQEDQFAVLTAEYIRRSTTVNEGYSHFYSFLRYLNIFSFSLLQARSVVYVLLLFQIVIVLGCLTQIENQTIFAEKCNGKVDGKS